MTFLHYTHHYESVSEIIKLAQIALNNKASVAFDRSEEKLAVNKREERLTVEKNKPEDKNEKIQTSGTVVKDVLKKLLLGTFHALNLIHIIHSRCSLMIYLGFYFT